MFLLKQFWHQVLSLIHLWPDTHTLMSVYGGVKNEQHELNTILRKHTSINDRKKNVQCMHALIKRSELWLNIIYAYINTWKNFESSFNCKSFWWVFFWTETRLNFWHGLCAFLWIMDVGSKKTLVHRARERERVFRLICLMLPTDVNHVIVSSNNSRKMFDRSCMFSVHHHPSCALCTHLFMTFSTIHRRTKYVS